MTNDKDKYRLTGNGILCYYSETERGYKFVECPHEQHYCTNGCEYFDDSGDNVVLSCVEPNIEIEVI